MSMAMVLNGESFCLHPLPREHFSMSGDVFNGHYSGVLLAPSRWKPGIPPNILQYIKDSPNNYPVPNVNSSEVKKLWCIDVKT